MDIFTQEFFILNSITLFLFIFEFGMKLNMSFYKQGDLVTDRMKIFKKFK